MTENYFIGVAQEADNPLGIALKENLENFNRIVANFVAMGRWNEAASLVESFANSDEAKPDRYEEAAQAFMLIASKAETIGQQQEANRARVAANMVKACPRLYDFRRAARFAYHINYVLARAALENSKYASIIACPSMRIPLLAVAGELRRQEASEFPFLQVMRQLVEFDEGNYLSLEDYLNLYLVTLRDQELEPWVQSIEPLLAGKLAKLMQVVELPGAELESSGANQVLAAQLRANELVERLLAEHETAYSIVAAAVNRFPQVIALVQETFSSQDYLDLYECSIALNAQVQPLPSKYNELDSKVRRLFGVDSGAEEIKRGVQTYQACEDDEVISLGFSQMLRIIHPHLSTEIMRQQQEETSRRLEETRLSQEKTSRWLEETRRSQEEQSRWLEETFKRLEELRRSQEEQSKWLEVHSAAESQTHGLEHGVEEEKGQDEPDYASTSPEQRWEVAIVNQREHRRRRALPCLCL